jgi:hypothetical protein
MQEHPPKSFNKGTVLLRSNVTVRASNERAVDINMPRSYMLQLAGCARGVTYKVKVVLEIMEIEKCAGVKKTNEVCINGAAAEKQRHDAGF